MRKQLIVLCLGLMVLSGGSGCAALQTLTTPAATSEVRTETRVVIYADAAFIAAATALNRAEANGSLTTEQRLRGELLRTAAHNALVTIRAAVDARRQPDLSSFNEAIAAINQLAGAPR